MKPAYSLVQWLGPVIVSLIGLCLSGASLAKTINVADGDKLQSAIASAISGDVIRLAPGEYVGNIVIDKPLVIEGPADRSAIILGERKGRTLWVQAPDVTIRNLTVKNSGLSLSEMDAGIFLDKPAHNARVEQNDVLDNSVGVYVWGPHDVVVQDNRIIGNSELRVAERGN